MLGYSTTPGVLGVARGFFQRLISVEEAIGLVVDRIGSGLRARLLSDVGEVGIDDLAGRLLAETIRAPRSLPWYPRSIVDGCAVRAEDVAGAFEDRPVELRVRGRVRIGTKPEVEVGAGECALVDTGSWVPLGADAVVPIEYVTISDGRALIERARPPGANIALPASDVARGDFVVWRGAAATPEVAAALAALGVSKVKASRRARVAVISTGNELVEPSDSAGDALIYDSNRYFLINFFKMMGYEVFDLGISIDDVDRVAARITEGIEMGADVVAISGGTSAGVEDVVPRALERIGEVLFHGLRIKPGKPTLAGLVGQVLVLGLPGNPRSTANVAERLVVPLLAALGLPTGPLRLHRRVRARLAVDVAGEKGRLTYIPVALVGEYAVPVARESYMIASYPLADGVVVIPPSEAAPLERDVIVDVRAWREPPPSMLLLADIVNVPDAVTIEDKHGGRRVLHYPAPWAQARRLAERAGVKALAAAPIDSDSVIPSGWRIVGERKIFLAARSPECQRVAVYSPYITDHPDLIPSSARVVASRRAFGARELLEGGYVDCALVPSDYADGLDGSAVGEEKIILYDPQANRAR
jgi:molybdenum cofactor synthesis domain-containing protein